MKVRVEFWAPGEGGPETKLAETEIIIPDKPETPPGTGRWVWIGTVPAVDIPLTEGWYVSLRPLRKDSIQARARARGERAPERPAKPSYPCPHGDRSFATKRALNIHLARTSHEAKPAPEPPPKTISKKKTPRAPPKKKVLTQKKTFPCSDCDRVFLRANELGVHRKAKHGQVSQRDRRKGRNPPVSETPGAPRSKRFVPRRIASRETGAQRSAHRVEAEDRAYEPPLVVNTTRRGARVEKKEDARITLAADILIATTGGPEAVDQERALRIADIVGRVFDHTDRAVDKQLTAEERADLHVLDGKMIRHEVLNMSPPGHKGRTEMVHWWVFHRNGVAAPPQETG